jgi:hypothetical protein
MEATKFPIGNLIASKGETPNPLFTFHIIKI